MQIKIILAIISILGIGCAQQKNTTATVIKNYKCVMEDLNYSQYQSQIDPTFNYAEDIFELYGDGEEVLEKKEKRGSSLDVNLHDTRRTSKCTSSNNTPVVN
jgi:hypothetical protein